MGSAFPIHISEASFVVDALILTGQSSGGE
jgi:hypothetical protein